MNEILGMTVISIIKASPKTSNKCLVYEDDVNRTTISINVENVGNNMDVAILYKKDVLRFMVERGTWKMILTMNDKIIDNYNLTQSVITIFAADWLSKELYYQSTFQY